MRLSTKARISVSAMMYLAVHDQDGPCNANDICLNLVISTSYLEQLFANLRRKGLIVGLRGPGGGYRLARPAHEITIADIVTAIDDHAYVPRPVHVVDLYHGEREHSKIQKMWHDLSTRMYEFLSQITLAECMSQKDDPEKIDQGRDIRSTSRIRETHETVYGGHGST